MYALIYAVHKTGNGPIIDNGARFGVQSDSNSIELTLLSPLFSPRFSMLRSNGHRLLSHIPSLFFHSIRLVGTVKANQAIIEYF